MNAELLLKHYERIADAPDAIAQLRRFVLHLAVRGKLVLQDPREEPAKKLLEKIADEKAAAVMAGVIKSPVAVRLAPSTDISVPAGWSLVPLADVILRHLGGGTPSKNNHAYWNGDIRWASVKDVGKSKFLVDTIDRITPAGLSASSSNLIEPGNLIVVTRMGLGKVSINRVPIAINQDLRALFLSQHVSIDYLYNFFLTHGFEGTGLTVKGIKLEQLLGIALPLPPLAEQHRIVAKVDELMGLCDRLEAARAEREAVRDRLAAASLARLNTPDPETFQADADFVLEALPAVTTRPDQIAQLRETILNLAVRGRLVPQNANDEPARDVGLQIVTRRRGKALEAIEPPFGLPIGWAWRAIKTLADQVTDGEHATPPRTSEAHVPLVTAKNVREGFMDYAQTDWVAFETAEKAWRRCRPQVGDLLLVCVGATTGRLTVLREPKDMVLVRSVALIRPNSTVNCEYLERAIRSPLVQQQIWASVKVTAQPCLYINRIQSLLIPLPPLAEQLRIVAKVDELMALCDRLEASLRDASATRRQLLDALLAEALTPLTSHREAA